MQTGLFCLRRPAGRLFARTCRRKNCIRRTPSRIRICRHADRADRAGRCRCAEESRTRCRVRLGGVGYADRIGRERGRNHRAGARGYLQPAFDKAATVGTLFEPDYEALHRYNSQLVITGGPGAEAYEQLAKNATTIDLTVDNGNIRTSGEKQMETLARIFGKEARAAELKAQIDALFAQTREAAKLRFSFAETPLSSEAPFSDDLVEYHRYTHRAAESKIQTDGSPHPSLCGKQRGYGNPSLLPVGEG